MRKVINSDKFDDAQLVIETVGFGIVLFEYDSSEFCAAYEICDEGMARELINAIREASEELGWKV